MSGIPGFMQLNPLMKLDGYYVLSQYVQLDNLRERSFDYTAAWLKRYVLQQDVELPMVSPRERRIFLIYSTCSGLYSGLIIVEAISRGARTGASWTYSPSVRLW